MSFTTFSCFFHFFFLNSSFSFFFELFEVSYLHGVNRGAVIWLFLCSNILLLSLLARLAGALYVWSQTNLICFLILFIFFLNTVILLLWDKTITGNFFFFWYADFSHFKLFCLMLADHSECSKYGILFFPTFTFYKYSYIILWENNAEKA